MSTKGDDSNVEAAHQKIVEGSTTMLVPAEEEAAVFYNPVQIQNRDLSVLMITLYGERRRKRLAVDAKKKELRAAKVTGAELKQQLQDYETSLNATQLVKDEDSSADGLVIFDALAASGLRSIRYWNEVPGVKHVTINDLDPVAVDRAHDNIKVNGLDSTLLGAADERGHGIRIQNGDATHEMYLSRRPFGLLDPTPLQLQQKEQYDVIDLDPYGSAAPFIDGAVQAVKDGGMLNVTCTDMAALGGSHPETCYGRYASMPIQRANYLQESALRNLLYALATSAAKYGRTIRPILSVGMNFYVRCFVEVNDDKAGVNELSLKIGSIYQSSQCPSFHTVPHGKHGNKGRNIYQPSRAPLFPQCEETGGPFKVAGPIWLGALHENDVVNEALRRLRSKEGVAVPDMKLIATKERLVGLLTSVSEELDDVPLFYTLPTLGQALKISTPPIQLFKAAIVNAGYRVSGYHKEPQAIKTDAPNRIIWDIMRVWYKQQTTKEPTKKDKKKKEAKEQFSSSAEKIMAVEPSIEVNWTIPKAFQENAERRVRRFPQNPEKHWGPKKAATGIKRKADDQNPEIS
jgi:tRNA (guanine26-N2/guanine27-N2)-dimethyltransferase